MSALMLVIKRSPGWSCCQWKRWAHSCLFRGFRCSGLDLAGLEGPACWNAV